MALQRTHLSGLDLGWISWISEAEELIDFIEPTLEKLVAIRHSSFWLRLPFLRRLRPPAEVEAALGIVRALKDQLR